MAAKNSTADLGDVQKPGPEIVADLLSDSSMAEQEDEHAMVFRNVVLILKGVTNYLHARGLDKFSTGTGFGAVRGQVSFIGGAVWE